jgi:antibiotic biosynthesis monooxygenase (ABM) superfamily enzyme
MPGTKVLWMDHWFAPVRTTTKAMIQEHGIAMVRQMPGSRGAYWARSPAGDRIQHSLWLFDTEENARVAESTFLRLREVPATFASVDVREVVGQA